MPNVTITAHRICMAWPKPSVSTATTHSSQKRGTKMTILHIEHPIRDFDLWKKAFDSDPIGRARSGVRRYQVLRPVDDPNYVMIDLSFDNSEAAEAALTALRELWRSSAASSVLMGSPQIRIVEVVESKQH
jgi:hypothetical protein